VGTGDIPRRDEGTGRLTSTETTAVVLVLLPGDPEYRFVSGFGRGPASRPIPREAEPAPLAPFFLAKHELTQGQWLALTGTNPSLHTAQSELCGTQRHDLRCPVDTVSSVEFLRVLRTIGLSLPTAAQWQYAARAGTSTPWWTGDHIESAQGAANLRDRRLMSSFATDVVALHVLWDDGFACSAQVGSFRPNAFGLHDTIGNVSEICLDRLPATRDFRSHRRPGSGEQVVDDFDGVARDHPWMAVVMGQSFRTSPEISVGEILLSELETPADDVGARPARALEE
jgi:formylglycine-generating enzyme required for sulfatase activity